LKSRLEESVLERLHEQPCFGCLRSLGGYQGLPCSSFYNIPYRCLLPKTVENLLVAGRCISCTHEALGSVRVMATSIGMGQAAGTAAAMAVKEGIQPRYVDYKALRDNLVKQGVNLPYIVKSNAAPSSSIPKRSKSDYYQKYTSG